MIHYFPEDFVFEHPSEFTDPFRYVPHPAVRMAAKLIVERIEADKVLAEAFSEGKMLGVLVCRECFIAAFSGNAGGLSVIDGFAPPIYDLMQPDGEFKKQEAEITELNRQIETMLDSDRLLCLQRELDDAERGRERELAAIRELMEISKRRRAEIRSGCTDPAVLARLARESQHEKAELKRTRQVLDATVAQVRERIGSYLAEIDSIKKLRAAMSERLQDWIFRQYIVHNANGESSSIADIFASVGLVPPGGTGECAAPKLLEYAYRNGLKPLAMGEFWYGKASGTAVRCHGRFYPSCTSKCGPLLKFMTEGLSVTSHDDRCIPAPVVIYEDEAIMAVEKPCGMPSVPGLDGRQSLLELFPEGLHAVHRLDMDTSGVMILAKTHEAAVDLRRQFEEHSVRKTYTARVADAVSPLRPQRKGVITLPLSPDYDERPRQKVDFRQGKEARTEYEVVHKNPDGTADLLLYPHTGRTHQLRVHCAHILGLGRPILGDLLYGAHCIYDDHHTERLCLHALSITFRHPTTGESLTFTSQNFKYI